MNELHDNIKAVRAISPVSVADTTATVSETIDRQGYEAVEFIIATGSIADADATFAVLVEESDTTTSGDFTSVADADLLGTEAAASFQYDDDNETRKIGYIGIKRYVRLTITPTGNASAALFSAVAILGSPAISPVA